MRTTITHTTGSLFDADTDALALLIPAGEEAMAAALAGPSEVAGTDLAAACAAVDVEGKPGQVARIPVNGKLVLISGAGADPDAEAWRKAAGAAVKQAPKNASVAVAVPADSDAATVQAVVEGAALGAYSFTEFRKKPHEVPTVPAVTIVSDAEGAADAVAAGIVVATAVSAARDMVNTPPSKKRPPVLAQAMADLVADRDVTVKIFDETELVDGGFGGILGVGQGSSEPPRLVQLTYEPEGAEVHVVLVGKGITFDTGGLSLKPWKSMLTMKSDMAGAAAVAATMSACAAVGVKVKVTGLCAIAENMPSGTSYRPSDVLVHRGGTTVEVLNTDAEGRLVMADALAFGTEMEPDVMIDIATLTGAQVVSLGADVAAVLGTDAGVINALKDAAASAGEQIWELPMVEAYAKTLESPVADLQNIGKAGHAGTITAALFLRAFTGETPWAHLDIAGPSFADAANEDYLAAGGTGFGVRTLLTYLASL